jgi:hypothetical protein
VVHLKVKASPATENGEGLAEHVPLRLSGRLVGTGDEQAREVIDLAAPKEQVQQPAAHRGVSSKGGRHAGVATSSLVV